LTPTPARAMINTHALGRELSDMNTGHRRLKRLAAAAAGGLLLLAFLPSTASGDFWFQPPCQLSLSTPCTADNAEHTYCWAGNFDSTNFRDAAKYAMENLDAQTDFYDNKMANCTANTDIVWTEFTVSGVRGRYECEALSGWNCGQARIYINRAEINSSSDPELNRKKTSCHEVGHSGGVSHAETGDDCMKSGEVTLGHKDYNPHHIGHLNDNL